MRGPVVRLLARKLSDAHRVVLERLRAHADQQPEALGWCALPLQEKFYGGEPRGRNITPAPTVEALERTGFIEVQRDHGWRARITQAGRDALGGVTPETPAR